MLCVRMCNMNQVRFSSQELRLRFTGGRNVHVAGGHKSGPFLNEYYDIEHCTYGGYTIFLDDIPYEIQAGQLYVIFPHVKAERHFTAEVTSTSYLSVKGAGIDEIMELIGLSREMPMFPTPLPLDCADSFEQVLDTLELCHSYKVTDPDKPHESCFTSNPEYTGTHPLYANLRQTARLNLFLSELMRIRGDIVPSADEKTPQKSYIDRARRYIESNFKYDITVDGIASYVGINRSYLFRLFREEAGMSVQEYLIRVRMNTACDLLRWHDVSVKTVAASVGYEPFNFSRIFKKRIGISPTEYREHYRK